jgi:hypothetical protein
MLLLQDTHSYCGLFSNAAGCHSAPPFADTSTLSIAPFPDHASPLISILPAGKEVPERGEVMIDFT